MLNTRRVIFIVTVFALLVASAAAQDAGQYVILNAQYGNERNHVDVTNRLRDLARSDRPFRIDRDSMNVDPDRGSAKMLRVFARGPNGQERSFDFPDGSLFDGAQFRSWNRGDWGDTNWNGGWNWGNDKEPGQYVILNAQYGTERNHVDVTRRLKELARRGRQFRINHESMDADPDRGHDKMLRVYARGPNGEQLFEYPDGIVFEAEHFQGWGRGDWGDERWNGGWNGTENNYAGEYSILSAQYGNEHRHLDVTNRLKEMARTGRRLRLDYHTFGDPDEGHAKVLRIFARGPNGNERVFEYPDGAVIDGAQFRGWGGGEWGDGRWSGNWNGGAPDVDSGQYLILSAQYGSERHHVDVTNRLKEMARTDRQFRLDYRSFGMDPDEGHSKSLRIFAQGPNGQEQMFEYRDGTVIDGAQFRAWGTGQWGTGNWSGNWNPGGNRDAGQFVIVSAQFGSERHHVDVTNRIKQMARTDLQFRVDYRTFGVDPDEGHAKVLRIYARGPNGRERMFEYHDGNVIDGAQFRGWGGGEWGGVNDRWSGRWEGEEREEHGRDRDRDER